MLKSEIQKLYYIKKDYSKIKKLLNGTNKSWSFDILGKIALEEKEIEKAKAYFKEGKNPNGYVYALFLNGEYEEARKICNRENLTPFTEWIKFLSNIIENKITTPPTYFEIRNFYEQDLEMLFRYGKENEINKITALNKYLEMYNMEIHKYTARVYFNNARYEEGMKHLQKSLNICYKDPEIHYMLGEQYEKRGMKKEAEKAYRKAEEVSGGYLPATRRIKVLSKPIV